MAGLIVASAHDLRAFQAPHLFDGATFAVVALVVLAGIPDPRLPKAAPASDRGTGFRAVAHDRLLLTLIAANIVLVMTGGALFSDILAPSAQAHTPAGPGEIGVVIFITTFFLLAAQIPATRAVKRMRRTRSRRDQRAICHRPARGPARNADEPGAHRHHRLGRGRGRDRDR